MTNEAYNYYLENEEDVDFEWEEHIGSGEWGSGEDEIKISEDMFWEFVEERMAKD
jgi:hypothetical protein